MAAFWNKFTKQRGGGPAKQAAEKKAPAVAEKKAEKAPARPKVSKEDTKSAYRVLIAPVLSEKASRIAEDRQYAFEVAMDATRIGVARAVVSLYGLRPEKVNIIRVKGKRVQFGRRQGKQKDWKKAIVTLKPGDTIAVAESI